MQQHRSTTRLVDLARGPGRLASALKIDRSLDGVDLCGAGPLWLGALARAESGSGDLKRTRRATFGVGKSPRIGIPRTAHRLRRFSGRGCPLVTGPRRLAA